LLEHVLAGFIEEGHLERHIRQMRMLYDQRRQVLVQALNAHLGKRATILGKMLDSFDGAIAHKRKIRKLSVVLPLLVWE